MSNTINPKWTIEMAIKAANSAINLVDSQNGEVSQRLQPDELEQLRSNTEELKRRQTGQQEVLTDQKSKTRGQDEAVELAHGRIMSLRSMIQSGRVPEEIVKAFGVGERAHLTVSETVAAGNTIINAYKKYPEEAAEAGIIEADVNELSTLLTELTGADDVQEMAKYTRKATTLDKNTLQREVEDAVTKISAIGVHVYNVSDPGKAKLFADLIPG